MSIQRALRLVCGNEHGFGDAFFPEDEIFDPQYSTQRLLRRAARKAGWRHYQREDYCPSCVESDRNMGNQ